MIITGNLFYFSDYEHALMALAGCGALGMQCCIFFWAMKCHNSKSHQPQISKSQIQCNICVTDIQSRVFVLLVTRKETYPTKVSVEILHLHHSSTLTYHASLVPMLHLVKLAKSMFKSFIFDCTTFPLQ